MFELKTYNGQQFPQTNRIYILSKGRNAGKPSLMPFVNSFVLNTSDEDEAQLYYFLCFALWKAKKFRALLTGTAIPFIRKEALRGAIAKNRGTVLKKSDFKGSVHKLLDLERQLNARRLQLDRMETLKSNILVNYIS